MSNIVIQHNIGAFGTIKRLSDQLAWTAAATLDDVTYTGYSIDREAFAGTGLPLSAEISALYAATLASGKTLSITFDVQDSADNSAFSDFYTQAATVAATGPSGGGAVKSEFEIAVDLSAARRYVRVLVVPDLSATATDTGTLILTGFFAGFDDLPAPQNV